MIRGACPKSRLLVNVERAGDDVEAAVAAQRARETPSARRADSIVIRST